MEAKHTPGPWQWEDARTMRHLVAPESSRHGLMISMPKATNKAFRQDDRSEDDANARLIAAAPALLEACKAARESTLLIGTAEAVESRAAEVWKMLGAAIAQAEGGGE